MHVASSSSEHLAVVAAAAIKCSDYYQRRATKIIQRADLTPSGRYIVYAWAAYVVELVEKYFIRNAKAPV